MSRQFFKLLILALSFTGVGFLLGHCYFQQSIALEDPLLLWTAPDASYYPFTDEELSYIFGETTPCDTPEQEDIHFPSTIGCVLLDKLVAGDEALEHARKIHGDETPLQRVFISHYSGRDEQVIIWLFEFASAREAREHMGKVNDRIKESQTVTDCGFFYLQNLEINYAKGLNLNNYYYNKQNIIYWISISNKDPIPLFLEFYQYF